MNTFDLAARAATQSAPVSTDMVRTCMVWAYEDAIAELNRLYDDIELLYKRKHKMARNLSAFANCSFPNPELCISA